MRTRKERLVSGRIMEVENIRSIEEAATEMDQGATLVTRPGSDPSFPAEKTTETPSWAAWKEPMAVLELKKGRNGGVTPMEAEMTCTPS